MERVSPISELRKEMREIAKKVLTEKETNEELDQFIEETLKICFTPLIFQVEVRAGLWVNYGDYLDTFFNEYSGKFRNTYFFPDFGLVQLLIGIYEGKHKHDLLDLMLQKNQKSKVLAYFSSLSGEKDFTADYDKKKLVSFVDGVMHLICCLCSNDRTFAFCEVIRQFSCKLRIS